MGTASTLSRKKKKNFNGQDLCASITFLESVFLYKLEKINFNKGKRRKTDICFTSERSQCAHYSCILHKLKDSPSPKAMKWILNNTHSFHFANSQKLLFLWHAVRRVPAGAALSASCHLWHNCRAAVIWGSNTVWVCGFCIHEEESRAERRKPEFFKRYAQLTLWLIYSQQGFQLPTIKTHFVFIL